MPRFPISMLSLSLVHAISRGERYYWLVLELVSMLPYRAQNSRNFIWMMTDWMQYHYGYSSNRLVQLGLVRFLSNASVEAFEPRTSTRLRKGSLPREQRPRLRNLIIIDWLSVNTLEDMLPPGGCSERAQKCKQFVHLADLSRILLYKPVDKWIIE